MDLISPFLPSDNQTFSNCSEIQGPDSMKLSGFRWGDTAIGADFRKKGGKKKDIAPM
jgi:hypothetical protein